MSGSISNFFTDAGNALEEAVSNVANEIGDAADDVRNEVDGNNSTVDTQSTTAQSTTTQSTTAQGTTTQTTTTQSTATTSVGGSDVQVALLYEVALDRQADAAGLAFWTNALQTGTTLNTVADSLVVSPEFQSRYGTLGTGEFVNRLYANALDREAEPAGRAFWTARIESGQSDRGDVALAISQSPEFLARVATGGDDPFV
jgi:hypothetical protein